MAVNKERLGFAKVPGHRSWPAEITGQVKGRILVTFFGSNQCGYISNKKLGKEWAELSQKSLTRFATAHSFQDQSYRSGVLELIDGTEFSLTENHLWKSNLGSMSKLPPSPASSGSEELLVDLSAVQPTYFLQNTNKKVSVGQSPIFLSGKESKIKLEIVIELPSSVDVKITDTTNDQTMKDELLGQFLESDQPENALLQNLDTHLPDVFELEGKNNSNNNSEDEYEYELNYSKQNSDMNIRIFETASSTSSDSESDPDLEAITTPRINLSSIQNDIPSNKTKDGSHQLRGGRVIEKLIGGKLIGGKMIDGNMTGRKMTGGKRTRSTMSVLIFSAHLGSTIEEI